MSQIEFDLIDKFGEYPLDSFDKFALQTHLTDLADRYCQDRVKQARSYLKSIFDEAIEQEFLVKDPTRKLRIPKNLRAKDKRVLGWDQLVDSGKVAQKRPPSACPRHDGGATSERALRSAVAFFR